MVSAILKAPQMILMYSQSLELQFLRVSTRRNPFSYLIGNKKMQGSGEPPNSKRTVLILNYLSSEAPLLLSDALCGMGVELSVVLTALK